MIEHSILMPARGAIDGLPRVLGELSRVMESLGTHHEILLIDDPCERARQVAWERLLAEHPRLRVLCLSHARGISAALSAGLENARGEILIAMSPDARCPVDEIARLVDRLARADAVFACRRASAWRKAWRTLAQIPRRLLLGREAHDPDFLFWAARREALQGVTLARGMHRFLPTLVSRRGYRISEIHVQPRNAASRTSFARDVWPNPGDLLAAWWLRRRMQPCTALELFANSAPPREIRVDAPEPLNRRAAPEAPRNDRRSNAP